MSKHEVDVTACGPAMPGPPPDHDAGLPNTRLWRRIATTLHEAIDAGTYGPGARLPTEAQLAQRFDVNRHTVRRALEHLTRAGLIRVEQGRGSFVAEDVLDYTLASRMRFSEWVRRNNKEPSGRQLDLREIPATEAVAAGLGLTVGDPVVRLDRLGLADGRPVSLTAHHFPSLRLPGLRDALAAESTITQALASVGVADYRRLVTRVTARMPTQREAGLLNITRVRPLLVTENINVGAGDVSVEFCIALHPTPRVQIVFEP